MSCSTVKLNRLIIQSSNVLLKKNWLNQTTWPPHPCYSAALCRRSTVSSSHRRPRPPTPQLFQMSQWRSAAKNTKRSWFHSVNWVPIQWSPVCVGVCTLVLEPHVFVCISVCVWHLGTKRALYMQWRGKRACSNGRTLILWSVVICTSPFPGSYEEQHGEAAKCGSCLSERDDAVGGGFGMRHT